MAIIQATHNVFEDVFQALRVLQKYNIDFDIEKEDSNFIFKIKTNEDFTLDFNAANKAILKEISVDFFVFTNFLNFTIEVDWVANTLIIQFII